MCEWNLSRLSLATLYFEQNHNAVDAHSAASCKWLDELRNGISLLSGDDDDDETCRFLC